MNNRNIRIISPEYVKTKTTVFDDVNEKYIRSNILIAQDWYLQSLLGSDFYKKIIEQYEDYETAVNAGTPNITWKDYVDTDYHTLIEDYIYPTLLFYSLYESYDSMAYKITNKGIVKQSSENSESVTKEELENLKTKSLNKAQGYAENLKNYLLDNTELTREFTNNDIEDVQQDTRTQFQTNGLYLKNTRRNRCAGTAYERFHEI